MPGPMPFAGGERTSSRNQFSPSTHVEHISSKDIRNSGHQAWHKYPLDTESNLTGLLKKDFKCLFFIVCIQFHILKGLEIGKTKLNVVLDGEYQNYIIFQESEAQQMKITITEQKDTISVPKEGVRTKHLLLPLDPVLLIPMVKEIRVFNSLHFLTYLKSLSQIEIIWLFPPVIQLSIGGSFEMKGKGIHLLSRND